MKKKIIGILILMFLGYGMNADNDRPIQMNQLPKKIQSFVSTYFPKAKIAIAKVEEGYFDRVYDLIFTDGNKIEFDRNGNWEEIDCKRSFVPWEIVPNEITESVKTNFSEVKILKIERKKKKYKLKLSNGYKLEFNQEFDLIEMDD